MSGRNHRSPPNDLEAEIAVLGSMLLDAGAAARVVAILRPEHFYRESHAGVFGVMAEMVAVGTLLDVVLVREELQRRGLLESVGGTSFLSRIVASVPTAANAEHYARIVLDVAHDRAEKLAADRLATSLNPEDRAAAMAALDRARADRDSELRERKGLAVSRVADVEAERVEWLWTGRFPRRKVVVVDGDPGLGKSTLLLDLAARMSRGLPMPFETATSVATDIVVLSAEDGVGDTIRPRLEVVDADLTRIHALTGVHERDDERSFLIPQDIALLEELVRRTNSKLVIVDPLFAFLGATIDSHKDHDVRRALRSLAEMAQRSGACIVVVRHLNKMEGPVALYRGGGSIGIIGASRVGLLVGRDPDEPDHRVLAVTKSNHAREARSVAFRLVDVPEREVAKIEWVGESDRTADELVARPSKDRSAGASAETFLKEFLAEGPRRAADAYKAAAEKKISERTLKRAKGATRIYVWKVADPPAWWWSLEARPTEGKEAGTGLDGHDGPLAPDEPLLAGSGVQEELQTKRAKGAKKAKDSAPGAVTPLGDGGSVVQ